MYGAIAQRATVTAAGAGAAWGAARLTGRARRANTVGLVALVGSQLGQTIAIGGTDPVVLVASLVSAGVLAAIVETPGVSEFFGCTPLGPTGWGIAITSSAAATMAGVLVPRFVDALRTSSDS
jgi:hypothetical protein